MKQKAVLNKDIMRTLDRFRIKRGCKGYMYFHEGLKMMIEYDDNIWELRITKELYPDIARKYDTTASAVERCMRHAANEPYKNGEPCRECNRDLLYDMYLFHLYGMDERVEIPRSTT